MSPVSLPGHPASERSALREARRSRPARLGRRLAIGLAALAGVVALAEIGIRTLWPQPAFYAAPGLYAADPLVGHRMRPGLRGVIGNFAEFTTHVRINRLGIRGPEIGPHREGVLRILVLGDSFAFGTGVEEGDAFPARLAAELTRQGIPAEGVNAGIGGYGVPDEVAWYEHYGVQVDPDVIVLAVFTGNDLQDAAPDRPKLFVVDGDILDEHELRRPALFHWLFQHSQLFALCKHLLPQAIDRPLRRALHLPEPGAVRGLRGEMALYDRRSLPEAEREGAASERAIRHLQDLTRARSAALRQSLPILALLLPSNLQADDRAWEGALRQLRIGPAQRAQLDRTLPNAVFSRVLRRCGVPVLDVTPGFSRAIRRGEVLFFPFDQHYTVLGHRRIAEAAAVFLRAAAQPPSYPPPVANLPPPRGEGRSALSRRWRKGLSPRGAHPYPHLRPLDADLGG
jgi:hypothetical protein